MIVRFDSERVQQTVDRKTEPIGVEGDPISARGNLSEADAIVKQQKEKLAGGSDPSLGGIPDDIAEEPPQKEEPVPKLNAAAVEAARKDRSRSPEPKNAA